MMNVAIDYAGDRCEREGRNMTNMKVLIAASLVGTFIFVQFHAQAQEQWPEKMVRDMECLKRHGLIQGTVADVLRSEAHFAPYYRETAIGRVPSIRYSGLFIEGKAEASPDIIKICIPNADIHKVK
jgi:hypothetical protein